MKLYTQAPNQDSSVNIQYPVFSGNKADEINTLIMTQVQDMATLDPLLFPESAKKTVDLQSAVTLQNSKIINIVFWGGGDLKKSFSRKPFFQPIRLHRIVQMNFSQRCNSHPHSI